MRFLIIIILLMSTSVFSQEMPETFGLSYFLFYEKGEETITPSNFFAPVIGDTTLYGGSMAFNFLQFGHKVLNIDCLHGQRLEIKRSMLREEFEGNVFYKDDSWAYSVGIDPFFRKWCHYLPRVSVYYRTGDKAISYGGFTLNLSTKTYGACAMGVF
jgi:hypothetical protein